MNTIQRTSSAGEPMIGDARKSLQAGIASMSPHYVVMEGPRRKVSLFHVSHVLRRKKQNLTKPHNTKKKVPLQVPSLSVSLLEFFCNQLLAQVLQLAREREEQAINS